MLLRNEQTACSYVPKKGRASLFRIKKKRGTVLSRKTHKGTPQMSKEPLIVLISKSTISPNSQPTHTAYCDMSYGKKEAHCYHIYVRFLQHLYQKKEEEEEKKKPR
jgi:hypothetical protein